MSTNEEIDPIIQDQGRECLLKKWQRTRKNLKKDNLRIYGKIVTLLVLTIGSGQQ